MISKVRTVLRILRDDKRPVRRLLSIIILKLPFDVGRFLHARIRVQDYFIYFRQSALSMAFWLDPDDRIDDYRFITSYLKEDDVYLDVGANIGTTLIPAAKAARRGRVLGFEPHPKIFTHLRENVSLNEVEGNVELHNCALGSQRGFLEVSSYVSDDTNRVLSSEGGIRVPVRLLDDFGEPSSSIALIKLDVEGYEKFVLEGGLETLERTACVYLEVSEEQFGWFHYSVRDVLVMLEKLGFRTFLSRQLGVLEEITSDYRVPEHHIMVFAIRNIEDFARRTGWRVVV